MTISYRHGDATAPRADGAIVIVHVCNDVGKWGKGFVLAISKRWSEPEYNAKNETEVGGTRRDSKPGQGKGGGNPNDQRRPEVVAIMEAHPGMSYQTAKKRWQRAQKAKPELKTNGPAELPSKKATVEAPETPSEPTPRQPRPHANPSP